MDTAYFPTDAAVPFLETVHDRVTMETSRGCIRGCRFCQAGIVYRPYREKSVEKISSCAADCVRYSGYSEISLSSLSISDYSEIRRLIDELLGWTGAAQHQPVAVDAHRRVLRRADAQVMSVRKSGLTFAPEAGTQRLRDVINKNITEAEILAGCREAFDNGRTALKLYFMNGLPTETDADIEGHRRARAAHRRRVLRDQAQRQGLQRDGERVLLRSQALYALPVGGAGFDRGARAQAAASPRRHPHAQITTTPRT